MARTINKTDKPDNIYGLNVYEDSKGRLIYYDILKKQAVYIPTFDFKMFSFYKYRYMLTVATLIVLTTLLSEFFQWNILLPIVITVAVYVTLETKFRKFINTKQVVKHFNKEECKGYFDIVNSQDPTKMMIKIGLYVVLGVLLVVNAYDKHYEGFTMIFSWGAMVMCMGVALLQIFALSKRKK